ncbi:MAG: glycosyltransferase family 4 protein [Candidatus Aminicenantales bacterium]
MRIDQLVPAFHRGDAIGDEAAHLKSFFRSSGFTSEIYCLTRDSGLERESKLFSSFPRSSPSDVTILHFALPSPLSQALARLPSRRVLIYHNITPPEFFADIHPEMADLSRRGRKELEMLPSRVDLALADSEYNRKELEELGYRNSHVFPLFIDFGRYRKPMSRFVFDLFKGERVNVLFVGRIAPNKKIENLIKVTFYFKKYISPLIRLIIIGKTATFPKYYQSLVRMADEFYLKPEEIRFLGHVPDEEMFAIYKASDVFLSLSEHEGFCLPLVESMIFDLPIIAFNSTAVPYTLGEAGILIGDQRADYVAELVNLVAHDPDLRKKIVQSQRSQLKKFREFKREEFLLRSLKNLKRKK